METLNNSECTELVNNLNDIQQKIFAIYHCRKAMPNHSPTAMHIDNIVRQYERVCERFAVKIDSDWLNQISELAVIIRQLAMMCSLSANPNFFGNNCNETTEKSPIH